MLTKKNYITIGTHTLPEEHMVHIKIGMHILCYAQWKNTAAYTFQSQTPTYTQKVSPSLSPPYVYRTV